MLGMAEATVTRQVFEVEKEDLQGLVARAYGHLHWAAYVLLQVVDSAKAKQWLAARLPHRTVEMLKPETSQVNFAFTHSGLREMGMSDDELKQFSIPFQRGMVDNGHRSRILGDDPESLRYWRWGAPQRPRVDVLVLLYAESEQTLRARLRAVAGPGDGLRRLLILRTVSLPGNREHFGFADGISQPVIKGFDEQYRRQLGRTGQAVQLNPGEFLLGYTNEFGTITEGENLFGRNGTYLVFRQMEQHVEEFDAYFLKAAGGDHELAIRLKAKTVGRWPAGAPLTLSPEQEDSSLRTANDFSYAAEDPDGFRCPIGAHIRRANPRDSLEKDPAGAQLRTNRRRLLRRGRSYGSSRGVRERGLHFICLCADLERQFEFVQQTWLNNPSFATLAGETDPLTAPKPGHGGNFTIQQEPVRHRLKDMPRFVRVRGGAYFFLPGIRALERLARP
jgi:Dyp-type peroxidase family